MSTKSLEQGDFIWVNFDPQKGHEQAGRRPAIVMSETSYNARSNMIFVSPITHTARKDPHHVALPKGETFDGYVMVEQTKALDVAARHYEFAGKLKDPKVLEKAKMILSIILE